jgi:hypothetical protein
MNQSLARTPLKLSAALGLTAATVLALAAPAQAHHSGAMFDNAKTLTIVGAVKDFKWMNPHAYIEVVSVQAGGAQTVWSIECSTPNILVRRGWGMHSLKPGDMITLKVHPLRDGGPAAFLLNATLAGGEVLKDHDY